MYPDGVCKAVSTSSCMFHSESLLLFFYHFTAQQSGWAEREMSLFGSQALTCSHFHPWGKLWTEKVSRGTELGHLRGGMMQVKRTCSSYPAQCTHYKTVVPVICCNISARLLDIHKYPLLYNYKNQCSLGENNKKNFIIDYVTKTCIFYILIVVRVTWVYKLVKLIEMYT